MARTPAARTKPAQWLADQARRGLAELPDNASWLLSRARHPGAAAESAVESASAGTKDKALKVRATVADAAPGGGDSVDARMKRAQAAAERAQETEEEAHRQARELASDAEQDAQKADAKVAAAERVRESAETDAKDTARQIKSEQTNGNLASQSKSELLDLAATIGIEGRSNMKKADLVRAIDKSSRTAA